MRIRRRVWVAVVLGALALGAALFLGREREPYYNGQPLSYWVMASALRPKLLSDNGVPLRLGAEAIPFLLEWIQYAPKEKLWEAALDKSLAWLNDKLGDLFKFRGLHNREHSLARGAPNGFVALGPEAAPAIPELERLLITPPDKETRSRVALALGNLGDLGLPVLTAALTNADPAVRGSGAYFLQCQGTNAWPAVPRLIEMLADPERNVGIHAYSTLLEIGVKPNRIIDRVLHPFGDLTSESPNGVMSPSEQFFAKVKINGQICRLQVVLDKSDPKVRHAIIDALRAIAAEVRTNGAIERVTHE